MAEPTSPIPEVSQEEIEKAIEEVEYTGNVLDPKKMIKNALSAPLHRGAIKYYKEKGWM